MTRVLFVSLFLVAGFAAHAHKAHREHGAHEHGHGELAIAIEGLAGTVELKAPGESIYGFEHEAKSEKHKKAIADAFALLEARIAEIVAFDASLECRLTKDKVEIQREKNEKHSEVLAVFALKCAKSPAGSTLNLRPAAVFPKLREVDATILVDSLQKSAEVGKKGATLDLK